MAWIESHPELRSHPKTVALAELMGWSVMETIGRLHCFWYWCLCYAPTGELGRFTSAQLALSADIPPTDGTRFVKSMVLAGWIDHGEGFGLRVHDWLEYAGRYLKDSLFRRNPNKWIETTKVYALSADNPRTFSECPQDVRRVPVPYPIPVPPPTPPEKPPEKKEPKKKEIRSGFESEFVEEWNSMAGKNGLPTIMDFSTRKAVLSTRMNEPLFRDNYKAALLRISVSEFCKGGGPTGWRANIDWFLKPGIVAAILEGKYDRSTNANQHPKDHNDRNANTLNANVPRGAYANAGKTTPPDAHRVPNPERPGA